MLSAEDRFAIEDLFALYHWALDMADIQTFADTLTDDALIEIRYRSHRLSYRGRSEVGELVEHMRVWSRFPGCQHHAGQLLLTAEGDGCIAHSYLTVVEARGEAPHPIRFTGRSDDRLVRHQGGWRFGQRVVQLWRRPVAVAAQG